jgi:hypothetical protein
MVIAEVNPAMPRTHGQSFRPSRPLRCDGGRDVPVTEYLHPKIGEVAERVARYIASIIEDGSSYRSGWGRAPNEARRCLTDRRDLGIHSDVITDGVVDLVEAGVVTGRRRTRHCDRIVACYCLGTRRLYDLIDDNLFSSWITCLMPRYGKAHIARTPRGPNVCCRVSVCNDSFTWTTLQQKTF